MATDANDPPTHPLPTSPPPDDNNEAPGDETSEESGETTTDEEEKEEAARRIGGFCGTSHSAGHASSAHTSRFTWCDHHSRGGQGKGVRTSRKREISSYVVEKKSESESERGNARD